MDEDSRFDDLVSEFESCQISSPIAHSSWSSSSSSYSKLNMKELYGLIQVEMQNPSDKSSQRPLLDVTDQLEEMLLFFCHGEDHLHHMRRELVTTFWNLEESKVKSYGAQYLDSDIPHLRMKGYNEECHIQLNENMSESYAHLTRDLQVKLERLRSMKLEVSELRNPGNTLSPRRRHSLYEMLHNTLNSLLMNILNVCYEVDVSYDGTVIYDFQSQGHDITSKPDLLVTDVDIAQPLIPIEVCSVLEDTHSNKSKSGSSQASGITNSSGITDRLGKYTTIARQKISVFLKKIKNEDDKGTHPMVLRNTSKSPNVSETPEYSSTEDTDFLYLHEINSRQLPDILKCMSLNGGQIENIRKKMYGQIINHLMGCVSEAFGSWHTGPNKDKIYVEEKGKRLLNEAWGFFVIHEIAIPVKLYCPIPFIVNYLYQHEVKYVNKYKPKTIGIPTFTVMNWYIDLSRQAGRRSLACFLKYNQAKAKGHFRGKKSKPYASI